MAVSTVLSLQVIRAVAVTTTWTRQQDRSKGRTASVRNADALRFAMCALHAVVVVVQSALHCYVGTVQRAIPDSIGPTLCIKGACVSEPRAVRYVGRLFVSMWQLDSSR